MSEFRLPLFTPGQEFTSPSVRNMIQKVNMKMRTRMLFLSLLDEMHEVKYIYIYIIYVMIHSLNDILKSGWALYKTGMLSLTPWLGRRAIR